VLLLSLISCLPFNQNSVILEPSYIARNQKNALSQTNSNIKPAQIKKNITAPKKLKQWKQISYFSISHLLFTQTILFKDWNNYFSKPQKFNFSFQK
jgi:hypothetical protein